MPRTIADGVVRISWVQTISSTAAPTVTELDAGTVISDELQSLDTPLDGEAVPSPDLSSAFRKTVAGTFGGEATGEFYRDDDGTDAMWVLFNRNDTGYIVIRRFGGSDTAYANADKVEVWQTRVITKSPAQMSADGSVQMFTVNFATLDEPVLNAVATT